MSSREPMRCNKRMWKTRIFERCSSNHLWIYRSWRRYGLLFRYIDKANLFNIYIKISIILRFQVSIFWQFDGKLMFSLDLGDQVKTPQDPQYFQFNGKPYPCADHSWKCYNWQRNDPDSCKPGHPSYIFMRAACPLSCKRCSTLVRI